MPSASRGLRAKSDELPNPALVIVAGQRTSPLRDPYLWGKPAAPGYRLTCLTVVGPYPTAGFFRSLQEAGMFPDRLRLIVDDAWDQDELNRIAGLFEKHSKALDLRYASCGGLVHAKLYLAEWRNRRMNRTVRRLGWGSANASRNGFGVNAEVLSFVPLSVGGDGAGVSSRLLKYFDAFRASKGTAQSLDVTLPGGLRVLLPRFGFKSDGTPDSFDAWIQSGRLCHQYDPDQTFGKISIQLKKPIPSKAEKVLTTERFRADRKTQALRFSYVPYDTNQDHAKPQWRSRYFVETWLGHWTSFDCHLALGKTFHIGNRETRRRILNTVSGANEDVRRRWVLEMTTRLGKVARGLKRVKEDPQRYFHYRNGAIDKEKYEVLAMGQISQHQRRARATSFRERFLAGYVFPPVPPFRGISSADPRYSFDEFVSGLCDGLLQALTKGKVKNQLAQTVRRELDLKMRPDMSGEDLSRLLGDRWSKIGATVRAFWKDVEDAE